MFNDKRQDIRAICLVMSLGCNLNCEYCRIAQSKHNYEVAALEQNKNIQALKDGTYQKNILKVLNRLNADPKQIEILSFWGQEPTLTFEYFTENMRSWLSAFPNVTKFDFSTNGMANADKIVEFCKKIEQYIDHPATVDIQFSYDGETSTNDIRGGNSETIKQTITYVIENLKAYPFKLLNFDMCLHGVLSYKMLDELNTIGKIQQYYKEMDNYATELKDLTLGSKNITIIPRVSLTMEMPHHTSKEDALKIADFIKNSEFVDFSTFHDHKDPALDLVGIMSDAYFALNEAGYDDPIYCLEQCFNRSKELPFVVSDRLFCSNNVSELKIMYDGTLINCQNYIYDRFLDNIPQDKSIENETKRGLVKHGYFINACTCSDEELEKNLTMFLDARFDGFLFLYHTTINLMYMLAKSGQIDESYLTDKEKILKHALVLTMNYNCAYNHLVETGSQLLKASGYIRQYCNGILDMADELYKKEVEWRREHYLEEEF